MAGESNGHVAALPNSTYGGAADVATSDGIAAAREAVADLVPDLHSAIHLVCEYAGALTESDGAALYLLEGDQLVCVAGEGLMEALVGLRAPTSKLFAGRCLGLGGGVSCRDAAQDPEVDRAFVERLGVRSLLCHPIGIGAAQAGVLEVSAVQPNVYGDHDVNTVRLLAGLTGAAFRNAARMRAPRRKRLQNPIAGIPDRTEYRRRLAIEVERAKRAGAPVGLTIVRLEGYYDIDALAVVVRALRELRVVDEIFRIDAGSFAIIMPNTPLSGAHIAARKVEAYLSEGLTDAGARFRLGVAQRDDFDAAALHGTAWAMAGGVPKPDEAGVSTVVLDEVAVSDTIR